MKRRSTPCLLAVLAALVVVCGLGVTPAYANRGSATGQVLDVIPGEPGPTHVIYGNSYYGQTLFIRIEWRDTSRSCLTIIPDCDPPTGTVVFYANGVEIGRSDGRAVDDKRSWFEIRACCLAVGTYNIQGFYFPQLPNNFDAGYSDYVTHTVLKIGSAVAVGQDSATTNIGQAATFTATVTGDLPGAALPTGTVQFTDNGSPMGGPVALSGRTAAKTATLGMGSHTIVAAYSGDGNYEPNSGQVVHTVEKIQAALTTTASQGGPVGTRVYDVAQLSGGSSPTGSITFRLYGPDDATCAGSSSVSVRTVNGNGLYFSDFATPIGPGTYRWTASYSGDATNAPATSPCNAANESVTLTKASPTIKTRASAGGTVGIAVNDVATVEGGYSPTGMVTFRLFSDQACTTQVFTSTNSLAGGNATSGSFAPGAAGTYFWTAVYGGDANNNSAASPCGAPDESVVIAKRDPTLSTTASPTVLDGAPVHDAATLSGGFNTTGTVTFRLFSDTACTAQLYTSTNAVGGSTATSGYFTPPAVGTYFWTAAYSGDANNNPATSPCNAPGESVVVRPFAPPPCTRSLTGNVAGPVTVNAGESVCIADAKVMGSITVRPGGAVTIARSQVSNGIAADGPAFFSLCGSEVSAPPGEPAKGIVVSNATVPLRIGDPAKGCATNKLTSGDITLSGNSAGLTLGGNQVLGGATVNGNTLGNVVVKANTITGVLACSSNDPPPTNSGQPNTALGGRTGQCAGL